MATTSSKVLGTVTSVVGEVKATASDGTTRILQVGDKVFSDEVISTSPTGDVKIALEGAGGRTLECGNDVNVALNEGLLGIGTAIATQDSSPVVPPSVAAQQEMAAPAGKPPAGPSDVAALQAAIAAGADPSQVAEATAAGGAPGAGGGESGGGHQPVIIEQGNNSQVVNAGFLTQGGSIEFPTPEFNLLPPEEGTPVVSVSVQVQVQVDVENPEDPQDPTGGVIVSGNAASLIEGTNGTGGKLVNFIISLDQAFDVDVQVTYAIMPGTAETPSDFFDGPLTQTVTIPAGETEIIIPVIIVQDHFVEGNETFNIVLTDAVNATINPAANTAVVTIVDDDALPVANPDTNWTQEDALVGEQEAPTASGNVLQNQSHPGDPSDSLSFADVADTDFEPLTVTTTGTFNGTYGTLVLNSDGSYTYTLNNGHADVQALDDGETLTDAFNYSVTDGFNAPDSSTLTITIFGSNDGPEITVRTGEGPFATSAEGTVNEAALAIGSDPESNDEVITGSFKLSDPNGLDDIESVTINDQTVLIGDLVGAMFDGDAGVLTITSYSNGIANFTYELQEAVTDGEGPETDVFTLTTSDGDSDSDPATITINIVDDMPTAVNDGTSAAEDTAVTVNVLANDTAGADQGKTLLSATLVTEGAGSVSINTSTGEVTFTPAGGFEGDATISYTMRDADGDESSENLVVTVAEDSEPTISTANATVDETGGLDAVTPANSLVVGFGGDTGTVALSASGATWNGTTHTLTANDGSWQAVDNGNGTYTFTQLAAMSHPDGTNPDDAINITIAVTATDSDGDVLNQNFTVTVRDDGPSLDITGGDVSVVEGQSITNGTWTSASGADAPASIKVLVGESEFDLGTPINTGKGTLTVNANGTWTFAAADGLDQDSAQSVSFTVRITDTDGDVDEDGHTVSITDGAGPGDSQGVALTVQEAEITDSASAGMSFTLGSDALASIGFSGTVGGITGDYADLAINWELSVDKQTLSGTVSGEPGATIVLTLTGVNLVTGAATVNVQISDEFKHVAPSSGKDNNSFTINGIEVVATDIDNDSAEGLVSVTVVDDVPSIDITGGDVSVLEGQSITNGAWTSDQGADGGVVKVVFDGTEYNLGDVIDTTKGTLTVNSNGTWTFAAVNNLDNDVTQSVSFQLKITDADGDNATDSHTVTVNDGANPVGGDAVTLSVDEDDLPAGSDPAPKDSLTASDTTVAFTAGSDDLTTFAFGSTSGISVSGFDNDAPPPIPTLTWAVESGKLVGRVEGVAAIELTITSSTIAAGATGNITVSATLLGAWPHDATPDADSLVISGISVVASDQDGDSASASVTVTVVDDEPVVTATGGTIENDSGESLVGLLPYDMNADGLGFLNLSSSPTVTSDGSLVALTSHGNPIVYQVADLDGDGLQELYAYADTDDNGVDAGDTLVFTLAPTTPEAADGSYTLTMQDVVDLPVSTITQLFDTVGAGGHVEALAVFTDEFQTASNLLISDPTSTSLVKPSNEFIGIQNNVMEPGETIQYEFGPVNLSNLSITHQDVNDVKLLAFDTGTGINEFDWIAKKDGATVDTGTVSWDGDTETPDAVHVEGGYDTLVFTVTEGAFKVGGVTYLQLGDPQDVNLNIEFNGADSDGDAFTGAIDVTITAGDGTTEQVIQTLLNNNQFTA